MRGLRIYIKACTLHQLGARFLHFQVLLRQLSAPQMLENIAQKSRLNSRSAHLCENSHCAPVSKRHDDMHKPHPAL